MNTQRLLLSLAVGLVVASALSAAEVRGVIAGVDLKRHELVLEKVKPRMTAQTFALDDKTQVTFGRGAAGSLKDLPVGRHARVEFEERDGKLVVTMIHVNGRPPAAPAAPAAPADGGALTGTLRRVAVTDREIVVVGPGAKGPETETTVAVPETAQVTRDGKAIEFAELKEGDAVAVTAEKQDGRWKAKAIQAGAAGPAPAPESNVVPRVRMILRIVDGILQQMEKK
jgi:hypothetical protein